MTFDAEASKKSGRKQCNSTAVSDSHTKNAAATKDNVSSQAKDFDKALAVAEPLEFHLHLSSTSVQIRHWTAQQWEESVVCNIQHCPLGAATAIGQHHPCYRKKGGSQIGGRGS